MRELAGARTLPELAALLRALRRRHARRTARARRRAALAVVTSRGPLTELVASHGAHVLPLGPLTGAESRELLERRLDPGRVAAEPAAAERIIGACARLPLALALVAARAATYPGFPLAAIAAELTDAQAATAPDRDPSDVIDQVRAVFSWSYATLTPAAARLFRLLGPHPGPDVSTAAAASVAGLPRREARSSLAELSRAGVLAEPLPGRYAFHDLLRAYAAQLARTVDPAAEREAATVRLLDHYVHSAHTADRHLNPGRDPIEVPLGPPAPGTLPEETADREAALAWLDAERPVLLAAQRLAAGSGRDTYTWQLAWAVDTALPWRGRWPERQALLGDHAQALTACEQALPLHQEHGDRWAEAGTWDTLGYAHHHLGDHSGGAACYERSLALFRELGDLYYEATILTHLGDTHRAANHPDRARRAWTTALTILTTLDHRDAARVRAKLTTLPDQDHDWR
jgi:tetratricopeptide (TPR) repeat protein